MKYVVKLAGDALVALGAIGLLCLSLSHYRSGLSPHERPGHYRQESDEQQKGPAIVFTAGTLITDTDADRDGVARQILFSRASYPEDSAGAGGQCASRPAAVLDGERVTVARAEWGYTSHEGLQDRLAMAIVGCGKQHYGRLRVVRVNQSNVNRTASGNCSVYESIAAEAFARVKLKLTGLEHDRFFRENSASGLTVVVVPNAGAYRADRQKNEQHKFHIEASRASVGHDMQKVKVVW